MSDDSRNVWVIADTNWEELPELRQGRISDSSHDEHLITHNDGTQAVYPHTSVFWSLRVAQNCLKEILARRMSFCRERVAEVQEALASIA